uniref:Type III-B CRISPR module RAMP protein Cmr1 n=1 Tax=Gracilinema caldarium TaxID=215591 RepID=A0A7C3E297_9SPIR
MEFYIERYKNRERLDFECEVITPMFISGADPKEVELRSASIKGALRFWWRALYGRKYQNIDEMKKAEGELFGDTEQKSKIKALIDYTSNPHWIDWVKPLPHKTNTNFTFPAIKPGYQFSVSFITDEDNKNEINNLFILFSILGGLGKRSRRGFGSFIIKSKTNITNIPDYLSQILNVQNENNVINFNNINNLKYPYIERILIGKSFTDYNTLLFTVGRLSHDNDCDFTGYAKKRKIRTHNNGTIEKSKRFASPLYISSYKIKNDYYPIISVLNTAFDPDVVDINRNENKQIDFINSLMQGGR